MIRRISSITRTIERRSQVCANRVWNGTVLSHLTFFNDVPMLNIFFLYDPIAVIVPQGSYPGQALMVRSPDGKQVTQAVIPNGCGPGQSFTVSFPTFQPEVHVLDVEESKAGCVYDIDRFLTPNPSIPEVTAIAIIDDDDESEAFVVDARNNDNNSIQDIQDEREASFPKEEAPTGSFMDLFGGSDDDAGLNPCPSMGAATAPPRISNSFAECKPVPDAEEQKILLVRVPRGVMAGSTIYVEIPGENRTVATTVPEGVKSFHICYTPRPLPKLVPPVTRRQMQVAPRPEHKIRQSHPTHSSGQQKLLLVRVPPGTRAGTTIHVSVPDEPGRILAAIVPAGGVQEFHVSYEARIPPADPPMRSFLAPTSPYHNYSMADSGLPAEDNREAALRGGEYNGPSFHPYSHQ